MDCTPRLRLPFLVPGQAQKELFHNASLQEMDSLVAAAVHGPPTAKAPASPVPGECFLVGPEAVGDWAGHEDCLAAYTRGGWRYVRPFEGLHVYVKDSGTWAVFRTGRWQIGTVCGDQLQIGGQRVVGDRQSAIASPSGGKTVDLEARKTIEALLGALRSHGLIES